MSQLLRYRAPDLPAQLAAADPRLRTVLLYAAAYAMDQFGLLTVTVTSVKRIHVAGTPWSVHEVDPCRGVDVHTLGAVSDAEAEQWQDAVNAAFYYDPALAVKYGHHAAWYETQPKALERGRDPKLPAIVAHLHLQVPPWNAPGVPTAALYPSLPIA